MSSREPITARSTGEPNSSGVTQRFAGFVSGTRYEDLPDEVVLAVKRILLDVVGLATGSSSIEKGRLAVDFVRTQGGVPEANVLGTGLQTSAALAAFANAELIHATDFCPILPPAHVSPYVTSPALALAERGSHSGRSLILAVALAHEVGSRLGVAMGPMRLPDGGIATTWGLSANTIGAASGAASVLGLSTEQAANAIGLSGYFAPVPSHNKFLQTKAGGGHAKYGPAGWTAQAGVTAALLARSGYLGDTTVLDGPSGFSAMAGGGGDLSAAAHLLGDRWNVSRVMHKKWPGAGNFQSPLTALTALLDRHDLRVEDIEEVVVENEDFVQLPRFEPGTYRAQVDVQVDGARLISMALHRIPISVRWQNDEMLSNPSVLALAEKVRTVVSEEATLARHQELVVEKRDYVERRPSRVWVRTRTETYSASTEYAYWLVADTPAYRASERDLIDKFVANVEPVLGTVQAGAAAEALLNLEHVANVKDLIHGFKGADGQR